MKNPRWYQRQLARDTFIKMNMKLFDEAYADDIDHKKYRDHPAAILLVGMIRAEFQYSLSTYSGDIFYTWGAAYKKIKKKARKK